MMKEEGIQKLLSELDLDQRGWMIVDHWEADLCAIGIANRSEPRRLVYVSTYMNRPGLFDYECEAPDGPRGTDYKTIDRGENVSFEDLDFILQRHLVPIERQKTL